MTPARIAAAAAAAVLLTGCASAAGTQPSVSLPSVLPAVNSPATSQAAVPHAASRARYPADWTLPDRKLSPGATQPGYGIADICPHVNPALEAMRPSTAEKNQVYAAYGITHHVTGQYEVDHIIPIELLGEAGADPSDPTRNLYPELNDTPDPAAVAREHLDPAFVHNSKDILEDALHRDVCDGQVPLAIAQHAIATDWRAAYVKYIGPPPSGSIPPPSITHRSPVAPQPTHSRAVISDRSEHAAPRVTHSAAPAACHPVTSGGNCYRAGEFCRKSDLGRTGVAGNGEAIRCESGGSGDRWESA